MDVKNIARDAGGIVALSLRLGLSRGAASQWDKVPADYVLRVSEMTGYAKTPHQIRPDLYPYPDDGLPESQRERCSFDTAAHKQQRPTDVEMKEAA